MSGDLQKLRIEKSHKARHTETRIWPWAAGIILLALGGGAVWSWQKSGTALSVETVRVRPPETAGSQPGLVMLNATGYIMAHHKIELASKVVGRVAWVGVEMGDKVEKDQVLVRLEDNEYKARVAEQLGLVEAAKAKLKELEAGNRAEEVASTLAQWERAKIEMQNAERNFKRKQIVSSNISEIERDDAEALMNARRAQAEYARQQYEMMRTGPRVELIDAQKAVVRQLEGALALAAEDLNNTIIRAPQASTILERNVEVGEFVTTGFVGDRGAKGYVLSIADLNDLLVDLDISQNDFAKVTADQACWITTDAYPDRKYEGQVELISPVANRQKATVQVRVKVLHPDDLLKPDMNATVSFLAPRNSAATQSGSNPAAERAPLRIPASAVRNGNVFVVEDGKVVRRAVTTGLAAASGEIEITKGLIGGEDLIVHPPENLQEGDRVKLAGQK